MALKIGGITVINDSRGLENITNLKTINGQSIVGMGDLDVTGSSTFTTDITVRGITFGKGSPGSGAGMATNTAIGSSALNVNTSGSNNTAIGYSTLNVNKNGNNNTATGAIALYDNTSGSNNTATGSNAMRYNTTGNNNTAIGCETLCRNTFGINNTATGSSALNVNTSGSNNTAHGYNALQLNTTGSNNTAIGSGAIQKGCQSAPFSAAGIIAGGTGYTNGSYNDIPLTVQTASPTLGAIVVLPKVYILVSGGVITDVQTSGVSNWGYPLDESIVFTVSSSLIGGTGSGFQVKCGTPLVAKHNTGVGANALKNLLVGAGNICIGSETSIGTYAPAFDVYTENNRVVMGHTSVTNAYIKVAWTVVSDARDKTNFASIPHGLDFVKQLKPTAYQFRTERGSEKTNGGVRYGFKAQDIAAIEPEAVIVDTTNPEKLYYNESNLIPILTKAIQELSQKYDAVLVELAELKNK